MLHFINLFVDFFMKNLYFIIIFWIFFFADFVLGFSNAWKRKEISSTKMKESVPKFVGFNTVILICLLFDLMIFLGTGFDIIDRLSPLTKTLTVGFCFNEFISCVENADLLGLPIPKFLLKVVDVLKQTNE